MKNKRLIGFAAAAVGAAMTIAPPAMAFHGGGGFGGMHGGGMHFGGGGFGGGRFGAMRGGTGFGPRGGAPFVHQRVVFHNFAFRRQHRFNNLVFVGASYGTGFYGDTCWRRIWTYYGWQWANVCYGYGY